MKYERNLSWIGNKLYSWWWNGVFIAYAFLPSFLSAFGVFSHPSISSTQHTTHRERAALWWDINFIQSENAMANLLPPIHTQRIIFHFLSTLFRWSFSYSESPSPTTTPSTSTWHSGFIQKTPGLVLGFGFKIHQSEQTRKFFDERRKVFASYATFFLLMLCVVFPFACSW